MQTEIRTHSFFASCCDDTPPFTLGRMTILILGGTSEARHLAEWLGSFPCQVINSLAGRTQNPTLSSGLSSSLWRSGGFGGIEGLVQFLQSYKIDLIIDATHPFARKISLHARLAAHKTATPLLHFERAPWQKTPQDNWIAVADEAHAASILPKMARVFLALGRQHLAAFASREDVFFIARMIEMIDKGQIFSNLEIVRSKPQESAAEQCFLKEQRIDMLVSRNSGGLASYGKIVAARALKLPVVMIARPNLPHADTLSDLQQVKEKILEQFSNF